MSKRISVWLLGAFAAAVAGTAAQAEGEPARGAKAFRQCGACHSLEPGRHLTGPSLAGVVGRVAGTAKDFGRYSEALVASRLTWDRDTLDRWLAGPARLVPGTSMRVRPVADAKMRADLIAFLDTVKANGEVRGSRTTGNRRRGRMANLKYAKPSQQVKAMNYCGDAYRVSLATGDTRIFWEFNLRFKSDASPEGPRPGEPVMVGQGMQGDRAQIVFADPAEISTFIRKECSGK